MRRSFPWLVIVANLVVMLQAAALESTELLAPARAALVAAQGELSREQWPPRGPASEPQLLRHVTLLLNAGQHPQALALAESLAAGGLEAKLLAARVLLTGYEYRRAASLIEKLSRRHREEPRVRELVHQWWTIRGDLQRSVRALQDEGVGTAASFAAADRLRMADLKLRMLDYAGAHVAYAELVESELAVADRHRAIRGLGVALFHLRRYDESVEALQRALMLVPLDADTLTAMADALLRLGRISESIDVLTFTLQASPWNERAHRLLGSGYTRRNYTQLVAAFPDRFADEKGRAELRVADEVLQGRRVAKARGLYAAIARAHPGWADAEVRLGSLEYAEGRYSVARGHYARALQLCSEYGRAHEGFARSIEALRLTLDSHAAADEAALVAAKMPVIPDIERFVLNWRSLSPRHQKRISLSLQPWARYIPALLQGEATIYVKPLYQLLSDTPHLELLRDQRIDYDSRLWDDVRGNGGHNTVFGIEDVETRIRGGYDTALHEVSHQVHAVLSPEWSRKIQALYAETTRRQATWGNAFLSQYAASSVWEYFAEGANSLHTPRRDGFDTREIVRERLQERDPALLGLARQIMHEADVEPSYAAAFVDLGHDRLSRGKPQDAEVAYRRALDHSPNDENALAARIHALAILGRAPEAVAVADAAHAVHPASGTIVTQRAEVQWLSGTELTEVASSLEQARSGVRVDEQYVVDLMLGTLSLNRGDVVSARRAFTRVRTYQPDNPQALVGLAAAEALDGNWAQAWPYYEQARQVRAGWVELRVLYARDLIRANEFLRAQEQIEAALLLDADDPDALAVQAWRLSLVGEAETARQVVARARELGPWSTLARIVAAAVERYAGNTAAVEKILDPLNERLRRRAPPEYVYRSKWGRYDLVYTLPAIDRDLMKLAAQ